MHRPRLTGEDLQDGSWGVFRKIPVYRRTSAFRQKRPIRNGRLGEIKGQDGFEAMVFGSL